MSRVRQQVRQRARRRCSHGPLTAALAAALVLSTGTAFTTTLSGVPRTSVDATVQSPPVPVAGPTPAGDVPAAAVDPTAPDATSAPDGHQPGPG